MNNWLSGGWCTHICIYIHFVNVFLEKSKNNIYQMPNAVTHILNGYWMDWQVHQMVSKGCTGLLKALKLSHEPLSLTDPW